MVIIDTSGYTWTFAPFSVSAIAHRSMGNGLASVRIMVRFVQQPMEIVATEQEYDQFSQMAQKSWEASVALATGKKIKKKNG